MREYGAKFPIKVFCMSEEEEDSSQDWSSRDRENRQRFLSERENRIRSGNWEVIEPITGVSDLEYTSSESEGDVELGPSIREELQLHDWEPPNWEVDYNEEFTEANADNLRLSTAVDFYSLQPRSTRRKYRLKNAGVNLPFTANTLRDLTNGTGYFGDLKEDEPVMKKSRSSTQQTKKKGCIDAETLIQGMDPDVREALDKFYQSRKYSLDDITGIPRWIGRATELKSMDLTTTLTPFTTPATNSYLISGIKTGTGFYNRIGRQVRVVSVDLRINLRINPGSSGSTSGDMFRFILYRDAQTNGALPADADLLQGFTFNGTAIVAGNITPYNPTNIQRFKIFADLVRGTPPFTVSAGLVTSASGTSSGLNAAFRLSTVIDELITYNDNDELIADIATGAINLFAFTNNGNSTWSCVINSRCWFTDE